MTAPLKVGESIQEGIAFLTPVTEDKFEVTCGVCDYKYETGSQATGEWIRFCHNRNFKKRGRCHEKE